MALTGFTDICESFPPFQIKSSRWDESKLKIQRTFLEVFPPDTVLPSVSPPRVILLIFFFLHISLVSFRWSEHFQQSFPKKNKTNIYSFYIKSAQKTKNKNQTFTLSARIWTQRCDSDFAQGCKISLESLGGVHVSLTVWPSPTQRPVDALIINCIAKNNPTTRLSSSGGGWSLLGNMHTQSESLPPPHRLQSHITAASLSVQKQKGEQITTVELRRSCSRSTEHRATPREDFRSRHLFIFTSAGGERRETTPSYEHVDQSGGSFSYKNGKTNQLVAGNNSTRTIWLFKRFLNTTVSEVRFLISRRESHVIS